MTVGKDGEENDATSAGERSDQKIDSPMSHLKKIHFQFFLTLDLLHFVVSFMLEILDPRHETWIRVMKPGSTS